MVSPNKMWCVLYNTTTLDSILRFPSMSTSLTSEKRMLRLRTLVPEEMTEFSHLLIHCMVYKGMIQYNMRVFYPMTRASWSSGSA